MVTRARVHELVDSLEEGSLGDAHRALERLKTLQAPSQRPAAVRPVDDLKRSQIRPAADVFAELGPWEGETTEEMMDLLTEARKHRGSRPEPRL